MILLFGVLVYLFGPILAQNELHDKIKIARCENPETLKPEMVIRASTSIIPRAQWMNSQIIGNEVEIKIQEDQLTMISNDDSKSEIEYILNSRTGR